MRVSVMRIRFNPRTQVGCDYDRLVSPAPDERFNPRTHVGCDTKVLAGLNYAQKFQSTHPRRVRPNK